MMNRNQWIGVAAAIAVILIFLIWNPFGWFQKTSTISCPQSDTNVRVGLDVVSDSLIHMYESTARLKAENGNLEALLSCRQKTSQLEQENAELIKENKRLSAENSKLKSNDKKFRREIDALKKKLSSESRYQTGTGTKVNSSYTAPNSAPVTNVYSPEAPGAQEFCVNIRTNLNGARDGSSYWPHLEADPPTSVVKEAVPNGDHTGWNIKLPPVDQITGLYGWSNRLHVIFVRADLIDKFSPTNVSMAGGMDGWGKNNVWPFAQKENVSGTEYYVAHY